MSTEPIESEIVVDDADKSLTATEQSMVLSAGGALPMIPTSSQGVAAQMVAAVQARYIVAERRPRDMGQVRNRLLRECGAKSFAEIARYKKPMGGDKNIEGLSIRFVEAALREYGNVFIQDLVVYDDTEKRVIKVSVTDLERNAYYDHDITLRKTVERRFVKEGQKVLSSRVNSTGRMVHLVEATDDELETKQGAHISKAIRTLGLRLLPQWLKEDCEKEIIQTLKKEAVARPDETKQKLAAAFEAVNVTEEMLALYLGHPLAETTPDEMVELRAVYLTLAEGDVVWTDLLAMRVSGQGEVPSSAPEAPSNANSGVSEGGGAGEAPVSRKARELKEQIKRRQEMQAAQEVVTETKEGVEHGDA